MHLKIWHKMIIGITIPSLIALAGGFFTYNYLKDIENRQNYVQIADDLKESVLELRRSEKTFLHFKNKVSLDNMHSGIYFINKSLQSISRKTVEELGKEDFSSLLALIGTYPRLITILFENYQRESTIIEHVRAEGRKLEDLADRGNLAAELSKNFVLNLRRLEKNYMLFRDARSYEELSDGLSQLKNVTPFCIQCNPYTDALRSLFAIYKESDALFSDLQSAGDKLEHTTEKIANRERERIARFLSQMKRLLIIALILVSTLGPLFTYATATYIVAPIKRLSGIIKKISEGDIELRAPIKEHDETYDLADSFNKMLDHLQRTHEALERSMELLTEKQNQLIESEKRASMGLLVSGVAHELNNPLNNIFLTAETILEDIKEIDPKDLREYILDILSQSERAQNIVENLLDFARARRSTEMEKLDIINVVKGSLQLIANQIRISNVQLIEELPDHKIFIRGNLSKLEQVMINILLNALQAMSEGGTITVRVKEDNENKNVNVEVSDTGPGISPENLKKIFEPFYTTKSIGEGTGLGLSVSLGLVKEHNGDIKVESIIGEGTVFSIILPLIRDTA